MTRAPGCETRASRSWLVAKAPFVEKEHCNVARRILDWMRALARLTTYALPPRQPAPAPTHLELDGRFLVLPADYVALLDRYGAGIFGSHLSTLAPGSPNLTFDIGANTRQWAELLRPQAHQTSDEWLPYPLWPEPEALVMWGHVNTEELWWHTAGHPDRWPVIVTRSSEQVYARVEMTATELLLAIYSEPDIVPLVGDALQRDVPFEPA